MNSKLPKHLIEPFSIYEDHTELEDTRVKLSRKSIFVNYLRLQMIRWSLRALNSFAKNMASRDQTEPKLLSVRCYDQNFLMDRSVSHPAPLPGLSLYRLFKSSAQHVSSSAKCLELGAGAGLWSLMCIERGAQVTATELTSVDLSGLKESVRRRGSNIEVLHGDLFEPVKGCRYDHIFFNPPFHVAPVKEDSDRPYFGGASGEVVKRFLHHLDEHLSDQGLGWIILPERDKVEYISILRRWNITEIAQVWRPLLGRVSLWGLSSKERRAPSICQRPMNAVSECFLNLSRLINTHSCELLSVRGHIDPSLLQLALSEVCSRHLLTRSILVPTDFASPRFPSKGWTWLSQHPTPKPQLIIEQLTEDEEEELSTSLTPEGQWKDQLPPFILSRVWRRAQLNPERSPPFEFRLLQGHSVSLLLIIAPHLCTDAFAGTLLLNQIAEAYQLIKNLRGGSQVEPITLPHKSLTLTAYHQPDLLQEKISQSAQITSLISRVGALRGILHDLIRSGTGVPCSMPKALRNLDRGETSVLIKRVSASELKAVLSGARARGVRAHTLFTWGLKKALEQWKHASHPHSAINLRIADLCTLRPLLAPEYRDEIDILVQPYTHTISASWSEEEALEKISKGLEYQKNNGALIDLERTKIYRILPRLLPLRRVMKFTAKWLFKTNLTTTNPGPAPVNFQHFGDLELLDFINFPQIAPPAELGIIYTTYREELRIVCLFDQSRWDQGELNELIEGLWSQVLRLSSTVSTDQP